MRMKGPEVCYDMLGLQTDFPRMLLALNSIRKTKVVLGAFGHG